VINSRSFRSLVHSAPAEWSRDKLRQDMLAGLHVVGPSFAIALLIAGHAGLSGLAALTCAVVGSLIVALLGGTTLGLSGPGLAMGLALADIGRTHGATGLALACGLTGVFQVVLGVFNIGRFTRVLPITTVHAFTFGIGVLFVIRCLPQMLGVQAPTDLDALPLIDHLLVHIGTTKWPALLIGVLAFAAMVAAPRRAPRVPVGLVMIVLTAAVTGLLPLIGFELTIPTLAELKFAVPELPAVPDHDVAQFAGSVFMLFTLATLETLLSASADEDREPGMQNDLDRELVGHGVATTSMALLGGLPVAGSILRTWAMRPAGAQTRNAAVSHAALGALLLPAFVFAGHFIPVAVLAGIGLAMAVPLFDTRPLRAVARVSRAEAIVLVATAFTIVFAGLLNGIEAGLVATLVLATLRVARFRATLHEGQNGATHQVNFSGPITFLSILQIDRLRAQLAKIDPAVGVILDLRSVLVMDVTGCHRFIALVFELAERSGRVAVLGASPSCRERLLAADDHGLLRERMAVSEKDLDAILGQERAFEMRAHVIANLQRFRMETREHYSPLFDQLADGQSPHTLFVTCVDSRIAPQMLTGAHPGELFILRCLGAIVPPPGGVAAQEGAALEYAIGVLGVRNVVICGHSQCGAVKAIKTQHLPPDSASLEQWLASIRFASGDLSHHHELDDAARAVTVRQLENLRKFPAVRDALASDRLRLMAWFYDVGQAELYEWDEATQKFEVLADRGATEP
jgi:carbonic anhydrase